MVSTFTPNINLEEPGRGDQVGTWDTPVNNNMTLADLIMGGVTTILLNNSNVVLTAAQFQNRNITFTSTLTGSVVITFPSTFKKDYIIQHNCTGSSAFTITLQTTVAGAAAIACRPGNPFQCYNNGTNLFFVNLGTEVGGYWDYAGSSVPNWVSGCTVPPYLNCDGNAFSSATYPALATILGGTILPDSRGRFRGALDQGTGRISSGTTSLSTVGTGGGSQTVTLGASQIPTISGLVSVTGSQSNMVQAPAGVSNVSQLGSGTFGQVLSGLTANLITPTASGTFTSNNTGGGAHLNIPPAYIGGLTLIRAA